MAAQACVNSSVTSAAIVIVQGLTLDSRLAPVLVTVRLALNTFYEWTESRIFKIAAEFLKQTATLTRVVEPLDVLL